MFFHPEQPKGFDGILNTCANLFHMPFAAGF
jgi:hypothetical protein